LVSRPCDISFFTIVRTNKKSYYIDQSSLEAQPSLSSISVGDGGITRFSSHDNKDNDDGDEGNCNDDCHCKHFPANRFHLGIYFQNLIKDVIFKPNRNLTIFSSKCFGAIASGAFLSRFAFCIIDARVSFLAAEVYCIAESPRETIVAAAGPFPVITSFVACSAILARVSSAE